MLKSVICLLGSFYLLDYDYPQGWQVSLSILQHLVFGDKTVHPAVQGDVARYINELDKYTSGE